MTTRPTTRPLRAASGERFATAARAALEALASLEATAYALDPPPCASCVALVASGVEVTCEAGERATFARARDVALRAHVAIFAGVYATPKGEPWRG